MDEEIHVERSEEAGRRGGAAAAYAGGYAAPIEAERPYFHMARWAGIWAGFVTAISAELWLALIGYGIFAPTAPGEQLGTGFFIWSAAAYLISLFIGGLLVSRLGRIYSMGDAIWNGVVLWGLNFSLLLLLISFGTASVLSGLLGGPAVTAAPEAAQAAGPGLTTRVLATTASGAWWFVLFQFLALLATVGGAVAGVRSMEEVEEHR